MTTFTAMTWNVENLFRPQPGTPPADTQKYQQKLALLAAVISTLDADVVGLQEVGGEEPLLDLQQTLGGAYPHRAASGFPDRRGIRVACLSKLPFDQQQDIVDFPSGPALIILDLTATGEVAPITRMGRGALRVRVTKEGQRFDVVTAHLKSKLLSFPRPGFSSFSPRNENERAQIGGIALMRRMAEALTLRVRANSMLESLVRVPLLVMGDLNDVPDAQTTLLLNGPPGSEIGTTGFHRPDQGDSARLFNVAPAIAAERRYSRIHHGRGELLDQIFASQEFFPLGPDNRRRLPVADSHVDFVANLPSVTDNPGERADAVAPDHAPVTARFEV